jgi:hypothetical protein
MMSSSKMLGCGAISEVRRMVIRHHDAPERQGNNLGNDDQNGW